MTKSITGDGKDCLKFLKYWSILILDSLKHRIKYWLLTVTKLLLHSFAIASAISVFPHLGGPYRIKLNKGHSLNFRYCKKKLIKVI